MVIIVGKLILTTMMTNVMLVVVVMIMMTIMTNAMRLMIRTIMTIMTTMKTNVILRLVVVSIAGWLAVPTDVGGWSPIIVPNHQT